MTNSNLDTEVTCKRYVFLSMKPQYFKLHVTFCISSCKMTNGYYFLIVNMWFFFFQSVPKVHVLCNTFLYLALKSFLFYFISFMVFLYFVKLFLKYLKNTCKIYITNQYTKQISKTWRQWTKPESKENQSVYLPENAHIGSTCKFSDLQSPDSSYKILKTFLHL